MPQLLAFLPCEKTIIANDQALSVIGIIESLATTLPPGVSALTPTTLGPMRWSVVTIYRRLPEDGAKKFRQTVKLFLPNGQIAFDSSTEFSMTHNMFRNLSAVDGFPVGVAGECRLKLYVSEAGVADGEPVAEFPVLLTHVSAEG